LQDLKPSTTTTKIYKHILQITLFSPIAFHKFPAHHGFPNSSSYNCSKAALTMLAKTLALEEAGNGVRVNLVSPGPIMTDMLRMFKEEGKT
jgi:NAD(P)-dependent dehydrogenase (short-subunit alcohol dehydrogenase family)